MPNKNGAGCGCCGGNDCPDVSCAAGGVLDVVKLTVVIEDVPDGLTYYERFVDVPTYQKVAVSGLSALNGTYILTRGSDCVFRYFLETAGASPSVFWYNTDSFGCPNVQTSGPFQSTSTIRVTIQGSYVALPAQNPADGIAVTSSVLQVITYNTGGGPPDGGPNDRTFEYEYSSVNTVRCVAVNMDFPDLVTVSEGPSGCDIPIPSAADGTITPSATL